MNQNSTFLNMPLSEGMKQTIEKIGYTSPTPIQEKAIPEVLSGKDLLGQAQTGTGKTAAFAIPLVELVEENESTIQALIVCPTRELCLQVCQEIKRLSIHKKKLASIALYGGQSIEQQFRSLKFDMPQIVVATPGRLFDHLRRKSIVLSAVQMIVLDEADEMLDMGFRPEIEQIFDLLPEGNQRIFFSATMPKAIKDLACTYLREPNIVKTESKSLTVGTIDQSYLKVRGKEKFELLCRMIDFKEPKLAVVFCNAKSTADEVTDDLIERGFEAGALHGDLSQNQRDRVMAKFKTGNIRVLIATDVAARGLDIDDVELVINFHLPHDPEDYVHRIGRTGRAGRKGVAVSLVEPRDNSRLRRISQFAKIEINEIQPPSWAEIKKSKIDSFFSQVKTALTSDNIKEYRSIVMKQTISPEDVAAALLQISMKKFDGIKQNINIFAELENKKYSGFSGDRTHFNRDNRRPSDRVTRDSSERTFADRGRFGRSRDDSFSERDRPDVRRNRKGLRNSDQSAFREKSPRNRLSRSEGTGKNAGLPKNNALKKTREDANQGNFDDKFKRSQERGDTRAFARSPKRRDDDSAVTDQFKRNGNGKLRAETFKGKLGGSKNFGGSRKRSRAQ